MAMTVALPTGSETAALRELLGGVARDGEPGLHLTMPRWTYRVATDLKDPLKSLGMAVAFGDGADFSGMTTDAHLAITDVLHQTYVAVDEAGTEAAAATAVGGGGDKPAGEPARARADRPLPVRSCTTPRTGPRCSSAGSRTRPTEPRDGATEWRTPVPPAAPPGAANTEAPSEP